jgi:hypothetical protein
MTDAPRAWPGTQDEAFSLMTALEHNCQCEFSKADGMRTKTCGAHAMLTEDRRVLRHLVFVRRMAARFQRKEFSQR